MWMETWEEKGLRQVPQYLPAMSKEAPYSCEQVTWAFPTFVTCRHVALVMWRVSTGSAGLIKRAAWSHTNLSLFLSPSWLCFGLWCERWRSLVWKRTPGELNTDGQTTFVMGWSPRWKIWADGAEAIRDYYGVCLDEKIRVYNVMSPVSWTHRFLP